MQSLVNRWKKLTSGSINRQIFGAAMIVGLLTALVKVAAVAKELMVAQRFGTGDDIDAFFIALLIPAFIINVIAGSFNTALIPTYMQVQEQEGKKAAQKLLCGATTSGLALLGITTILMIVLAPFYLPRIAAGFSSQKLELTFHLLCAIAPFILLSGIIVIWGAVLNAGERFALAAFSPIITPTVTVVLLLTLKSWGIFALAAGLVCGAILEIILLGIALHRQGISWIPKWYGFDSNLRQVVSQYFPMIAGGLLMCSTNLVDQSMAAMLLPGSVAALNYGNKVIAFPMSLATTALSTAVIPYFSKMIAANNWIGTRRTLRRYIQIIFLTTILLSAFLFVFSETIVRILFQRGSFTADDTRLVAQIQNCFALQIPFHVAGILVVRLISAMQANHILMWASAYNLINNIVFNYLFLHYFGVAGIALSTALVSALAFLFLSYFADKNLKKNCPSLTT
ncbi:MAG: murein biosynthesis integral membrane protein MurJ [Nostoc sp. ZfuVER08]|jgi:putative peptidoglycan lipid II flippase|uniref:Polysaccharide biosynthesis C-terminal domain-containing protein n=1 Tax=Nostoc punctiforme FACHB-252 TaxID=1357509 RepID=A0ABR8HGJ4_NOSPU|nr:lipid II flippase MurJ [Nostoc punctiforme]MBD2614928.1 polysaccharide biosynthesis C-terminal domain-containing protein [Nostoc punctiforme FACHB-252]MBL1200500.1 virulence factor MviN [Nostoc sp. GBBB01]MDZ8013455.1 lipid II flippase MurJ [Nostoc sp. ZfuVER08]